MTGTLYGPEFFVERRGPVINSASVVVPVVVELLNRPASVLDVGCGQGEWMEAFSAFTPDVFGVDIAAPTGPRFAQHDLTGPLDLGRTFGLVASLEVAEHLPATAADTFVDSLVRHGRRVLFSAAVPGQAGIGHINCRPHEYWHRKFADRGYVMRDIVRPLIATAALVSPWYRDNIFLYETGTDER